MTLPRWSPLLAAVLPLLGGGCRDKPPPDDAKPVSSAEVVPISLKGVDITALTPRERREWSAQVSELLAPCPDVPVSIAQCVQEQRACKKCLPAAQLLLKQVQAGKTKKEREEAFHARFDEKNTRTVTTDGSPELGSPDAVVTIVEWADFECPFCKLVSPILDELVQRFDGQVRMVFKFYPLPSHTHGEIAARAAVAAHNQGKFWEMHHLIFENQERLEQSDLERYAKQIGLDVPRFRVDLTAAETTARIEKDKKQADDAGLDGTPMIFINGRKVSLEALTGNVYEDLEDWVKLDIELAGKTPKPAPPPKGSAAPSVAPSASAAASVENRPANAVPPSTSANPGKK